MEDLGHKRTDKLLENLENELNEVYSKTFLEIVKDIDKIEDIFAEYSKELDAKERMKLWNRKDRLNKLLKSVTDEMANVNITASRMIAEELINVYSLNYNYGAYLTEMASGKEIYANLYNRNAIKELIANNVNPFTMISLDKAKDKDLIYRSLKREFTTAIIKGDTIQQITKRVQKVTEKNFNDSKRIARTETTRIESMGRQDSFKKGEEMGLQLKKTWISTLDNRTRLSHQNLMGETVDLDDKFSNGLEYPASLGGSAKEVCNCRCTHVVEFEGLEKSAELKDLEKSLLNQNFDEWENKFNNKQKEKEEKIDTKKDILKMNYKELQAKAKEMNIIFGDDEGEDFPKDLPIELIQNNMKWHQDFLKKYPNLSKHTMYYGQSDRNKNICGACNINGQIRLNKNYYTKWRVEDLLFDKDTLKYARKRSWHVPNSSPINSTYTHELGHYISVIRAKQEKISWDTYVKRIRNEVNKEYEKIFGYKPKGKDFEKLISEYGGTSTHESYAEAFCESFTFDGNYESRDNGQYYIEIYKEIFDRELKKL